MKKIGLIKDKKSKKLFLLPEQIQELTSKGVEIYVQAGYGLGLNIEDVKYLNAGAKIMKKQNDIFLNADIILKVNAFKKSETSKCNNKILVTMANFIVNAPMILDMLKNNVTGLAWSCLANKDEYVFFKEFETIKGRHCANQMIYAWANKGLGISNAKIDAPRPRIIILNATYAAYEAIRACLANNIDVTLLDNDQEYLKDLQNSPEVKKLESIYGAKLSIGENKFEDLMKLCKTHQGLINTCTDPMDKTKLRITAEMAKSMPAGSCLIDAACENGYGFNFQKQFAKDTIDFKQFDNVIFSCVSNITDLYPSATSALVSNKSVNYLFSLADKGTDATPALSNIVVVKNGKVINSSVKKQLNLL